MAYAKCNNTTHANLTKVNNIAKASIAKINNVGVPASGATRWAIATDDGYVSWANAADIETESVWEGNAYLSNSSLAADAFEIAYGKDGSGNAQWMASWNSSSREISFDANNDITDESAWTVFNVSSGGKIETIVWGAGDGASDSSSGSAITRADVWLAAGRNTSGNVYVQRTVDGGSNWTALNLDGLTNISDSTNQDHHIRGLASDGTGNWMLAQRGNLYFSSDSGVSFSFLIQPTGDNAHFIRDVVFTNNTWVILVDKGSTFSLMTCANAVATSMDATGDWSSEVAVTGGGGVSLNASNLFSVMAAANGNVCIIDHADCMTATVDGKNSPVIQGNIKRIRSRTVDSSAVGIIEGQINCIATDGSTWLIGSDGASAGLDGADIARSTDNGANWAQICEGIDGFGSGDRKIEGIAPNVVLPL
jgi:hypothetical protein